MEVGLVRKINIDNEMQSAYLSYAMSVIVSRALPDARDGLKPVQRRILYAMHDMGVRPDSAYKKSARIVGEVLGKYHPHGDASVYEAMARMAQPFSMRYQLVDGQGNFGSVDGDEPAAMRYTEARLAPMAMDVLSDIEKDTVDFVTNFDDTLEEPQVLPSMIPNLLVNGASGIAVGMATSVPPHNLGEVCDALIYMLERWSKLDSVTVDNLIKYIKGPDFPTGGVIVLSKDDEGLAAAYGSGRARITVQAKVHMEDMGRGKSRIIVTELPYQTNKASLIERIADLARDGTLEGLADLRDESDRQGMRIVIELQKSAEPDKIIQTMFKRTAMQGTFSLINLALVNGEPRLLTLKQSLRVFLDHRLEVVRRRSEHDLARARERAHILEGLLKALKFLDDVIKIIRGARDTDEARAKLKRRFKLSDAQTTAILDMPLKRLAALERKKIDEEYKEKVALIKHLEGLLASPKKMRQVIQDELRQIKQKYADPRRTQIVIAGETPRQAMTAADLVPQEEVWVTVLRSGQISRMPARKTPKLASAEAPLAILACNTRDTLYLLTLKGRAATVPVYSVPEKENAASGAQYSGLSALDANAHVVTAVAVSAEMVQAAEEAKQAGDGAEGGYYLFLGTAGGMVKKISVADLPGPSSQVHNVMNVGEKDRLIGARLTTGSDEILLVTALGRAIRFKEQEVRPMGLGAAGVMGIKPGGHEDDVVGLDLIRPRGEAFLITDAGMGKRTALTEYPTQGRYGVGVVATGLAGKQRLVGMCTGYAADKVVVVTSKAAAKTLKWSAAKRRGRPARGSGVVKFRGAETASQLVPMLPQPSVGQPETAKRGKKKKAAARGKAKPAARRPARGKTAPKKTARTPSRSRTIKRGR